MVRVPVIRRGLLHLIPETTSRDALRARLVALSALALIALGLAAALAQRLADAAYLAGMEGLAG
jgi:hypothetical protein